MAVAVQWAAAAWVEPVAMVAAAARVLPKGWEGQSQGFGDMDVYVQCAGRLPSWWYSNDSIMERAMAQSGFASHAARHCRSTGRVTVPGSWEKKIDPLLRIMPDCTGIP